MKTFDSPEPWNKGKLIGQKAPPKSKDIRAIRFHLQQGRCIRDLALSNLAINGKLRGCDLVDLRLRDIPHGNQHAQGNRHAEKKPNGQSDSK